MKTILLFAIAMTVNPSCSTNDHNQSHTLDLTEIAEFALNKQVKIVVDSLKLNVDELTFIEDPPGIINGVIVDYSNKGTIKFFFERSSVIDDTLSSNEHYLKKVAGKNISEIEWKNVDGTKGSMKNVKVY